METTQFFEGKGFSFREAAAGLYYLSDFRVIGSKFIKGLKQNVYRLTSNNGGCWNGNKSTSIFYDGNDLIVRVCFPSLGNYQIFTNSVDEYVDIFALTMIIWVAFI